MTLDEAIKHCEDKVKCNEDRADKAFKRYCVFPNEEDRCEYDRCASCAEEHKQLAEWLSDYKRLLELEQQVYNYESALNEQLCKDLENEKLEYE